MIRRGFLAGLLAAPIAGPSIAKEAITETLSPGLLGGAVQYAGEAMPTSWRNNHETILSTMAKRKLLHATMPGMVQDVREDKYYRDDTIKHSVNALKSVSKIHRRRMIIDRIAKRDYEDWVNAPANVLKRYLFNKEHKDANLDNDYQY